MSIDFAFGWSRLNRRVGTGRILVSPPEVSVCFCGNLRPWLQYHGVACVERGLGRIARACFRD